MFTSHTLLAIRMWVVDIELFFRINPSQWVLIVLEREPGVPHTSHADRQGDQPCNGCLGSLACSVKRGHLSRCNGRSRPGVSV